jgi:hypothetical protein
MPIPSLTLWADSNKNQLLSDWQSASGATAPNLKQGDTVGVELHWVRSTGSFFEEVIWSPSTTIRMAIGAIDKSPTMGNFAVKFGANTTASLQFNCTALQMETALNAIASISALGGVTVSKTALNYRILFNTAQAVSTHFEVGFNDLYPTSSMGFTVVRAGSATVRALTQLAVKQSPIAYTETWVNQDAPTPSVSVIKNSNYAGDTKIWRLKISPSPKEGTITLSWLDGTTKTTSQISIEASAVGVRDALNAVGTTQDWSVTKSGAYSWDISTSGTPSQLSVNGGGLLAFSSKYAQLSLNTVEVENFLAGSSSATAIMEIEVETDGNRQTLVQTSVTIVNDLIDDADYTIVERGDVMPVDSVVRYDTSQALTTEQKSQARTNIGALASVDGFLGDVTDSIDSLDARVTVVEGLTITTNERSALNGSSSPSGSNVFVTSSVLTTGLGGKANTTHNHTIADVTGLDTALGGKASSTHNHAISDVAGLQTELDDINNSISNINVSGIIGLSSQDIKNALDTTPYSSTATNWYTTREEVSATVTDTAVLKTDLTTQITAQTAIDTTSYESEVLITINGVQYALVARQIT